MLLHKGYVVCPGTCKPRVPWWQRRNNLNPADKFGMHQTNLSTSLTKADTNLRGGCTLWCGGERGRTPSPGTKEIWNPPSGTTVNLEITPNPQEWVLHWGLLVIPHMLPLSRVLAIVNPVGAGTHGTGKVWTSAVYRLLCGGQGVSM